MARPSVGLHVDIGCGAKTLRWASDQECPLARADVALRSRHASGSFRATGFVVNIPTA
jgi:hypothetical protein